MSATRIISGVLSLTMVCAVRAQTLPNSTTSPSPYGGVSTLLSQNAAPPVAPPPTPIPPSAAIVQGIQPVSPAATDWHASSPSYCCSPVGGNGPIGAEIFLYSGPTIPAGGGTLFPRLKTGWMVELGGRSLFFNTEGNAAWSATLGLSYQINGGELNSSPFFYFNIPVVPRDLSRWAFSFSGGRDWFLYNSGSDGGLGRNLRFGADVGGRWGTSWVSLLEAGNPDSETNYLRRQDVYRSLFLGAQINFEWPMGGWVLFGGLRSEYCFNWWTDLLPGSDNRLNDVNILLTAGFRY